MEGALCPTPLSAYGCFFLSHPGAIVRICDSEGKGPPSLYVLSTVVEGIEKGGRMSTIEDRYGKKTQGYELDDGVLKRLR